MLGGYVRLSTVLRSPTLREAEVIAGKRGADGIIRRVSVFDCRVDQVTLRNEDILRKGDIFISCLEQFSGGNEGELPDFLRLLIEKGSAGLIIIGEEYINLFGEEARAICDEAGYPVIYLKPDVPYAVVMDTINQYIVRDSSNAMNLFYLQKIRYESLSAGASVSLLENVCPDLGDFLEILQCFGTFRSEIDSANMYIEFLDDPSALMALDSGSVVFLISADSENAVRKRAERELRRIREALDRPVVGASRIRTSAELREALEEARRALRMARAMDLAYLTYDPLSVTHLLMTAGDSAAADDFCGAFEERIRSGVSEDKLPDILRTIEVFVEKKGSYAETASALSQHENTIRYRVNRVRKILGMEDDIITFHETIAAAVKLRAVSDRQGRK